MELKKITIKISGAIPWTYGVQDRYKTENYSYEEYTVLAKAANLKYQIK